MTTTSNGHEPGAAAPGHDDAKHFATLRARAAMHGVTLTADSQPRYLASRWGLTRELADLPAVERWLELVSGSRT